MCVCVCVSVCVCIYICMCIYIYIYIYIYIFTFDITVFPCSDQKKTSCSGNVGDEKNLHPGSHNFLKSV